MSPTSVVTEPTVPTKRYTRCSAYYACEGGPVTRYETFVEAGTVYVASEEGRIDVGDVDGILDVVGGPAWTITYTDAAKERRPSMGTSDEGLVVDVVDIIQAMTHGEKFVRTLEAHPVETPEEDALAPRTGLFVGKLLENLENGVA